MIDYQAKSDKKLVAQGILWNCIQMVVNQSFAFIIKLVLAKLLFPVQFGLIGMATIFTGFVQVLNDLGVGAALVQRKDKHLFEEHFHTAFWTGVTWSVGLYLIMSFAVGPLAAMFYNQPMLVTIIPVLSLAILFSPVNLVHKAQLTKSMDFKKIAFIDNASNIAAGIIALALAFWGAGVWALVFNSVAIVVISMPLYFKATGWLPKFMWSKQAFKDIFGFGAYTTGSNILNYMYNNIDYLLIGKLLGASVLGIYTLAFVLTDTFRSRIMAVINNVMYPVYGRKQNDALALKGYYLKVVQFNCIVVFPIMVFFIVLGKPFVENVFGLKWQDAVVPLQILAGSVMLHILVSGNTALLRGVGRPGLEMKLQIVKALIFLPTLAFGIKYNGIVGAAWAILFNKFVVVVVAQYSFTKISAVKIRVLDMLKAIKGPLVASLVSCAVGYAFAVAHLHYLSGGIALFITYFLVVFWLMNTELKAIFKLLKGSN
ncbi:lipopolysaccharide biosynthesis protein [Mucilaginibacter aquaedulcis]|jgi:teichuronic acid exporter|uniref:lipopolysaccharide biosynthesis protein n=1 Tax=Mucilaginibacter aquaedulcis TaxID=1187081 RepID=UPI0025B35026|nr:lipopolysaccharide biosynthesis protein [Mucilaginibacter aquaedulcis]MDN3550478.1 lipopolysaccharide biosynthesis protein [Mucilaginibacter aquaedulcis]